MRLRAVRPLALIALAAACSRSEPAAIVGAEPAWFEEAAAEAGLTFEHVFANEQRFDFPEVMCGGVALLDYDGDGQLDVYLVQGGDVRQPGLDAPPNRMYRNRGDGTFADATEASGTGDRGYGMGCACADYDGDGDVDLYVTNVGPNTLYRNDGDGTFTDVTETTGVGDPGWSASAAFADYDSDGHPDLYVVNYLDWSVDQELDCRSQLDERGYCTPNNYQAPARDTLYRNTGGGAFVDVSLEAGLGAARGNGLGVAPGDFNGDGAVDFYVANDQMRNQLWVADGAGAFQDKALAAGCAVNRFGSAEAGMGVMASDLDQDGRPDLFLSHLHRETNTLYVNRGSWFAEMTAVSGLGAPSTAYTGFGLGIADFDHDGELDVFVANGRVVRVGEAFDANDAYAEPNQLFAGRGDLRFAEVTPRGGAAPVLIATSRGAAFGDVDNDGDVDVVVANRGAAPHLLRNVAGARGGWILLRVLDRGVDALGASVEIEAGGRVRRRTVQRAYGYCSSSDARVHFGLGAAARVDQVTVRWPDGGAESFGPLEAGRIHELQRGAGDG